MGTKNNTKTPMIDDDDRDHDKSPRKEEEEAFVTREGGHENLVVIPNLPSSP